jgi:hypothetical protein
MYLCFTLMGRGRASGLRALGAHALLRSWVGLLRVDECMGLPPPTRHDAPSRPLAFWWPGLALVGLLVAVPKHRGITPGWLRRVKKVTDDAP